MKKKEKTGKKKKEATQAAKEARQAKNMLAKRCKQVKTKGMKRSKDEAVDTCTQDQPKQNRPTTQVHNMSAMITATRLIQAKKEMSEVGSRPNRRHDE